MEFKVLCLTEEKQKGQKQQQELPEFGKASETQSHTDQHSDLWEKISN